MKIQRSGRKPEAAFSRAVGVVTIRLVDTENPSLAAEVSIYRRTQDKTTSVYWATMLSLKMAKQHYSPCSSFRQVPLAFRIVVPPFAATRFVFDTAWKSRHSPLQFMSAILNLW